MNSMYLSGFWVRVFETVVAVLIVGVPAYLYRLYQYKKQENTLHELAKLRTSGVILRNEGLQKNYTLHEEFYEWNVRIEAWNKELNTTAEKFSPVVSERLRTLDRFKTEGYKGIVNPDQTYEISYVSETLKRVDHILETRFRPTHTP